MPDETPQVQAPVESQNTSPATIDPLWHLLFDRLGQQDENLKRAVDNTVIIAGEQAQLRAHVNDEQEKLTKLLLSKVGRGEVLSDLWQNFKIHRPAQVIVLAVVTAMIPVIANNWGALVDSLRSAF